MEEKIVSFKDVPIGSDFTMVHPYVGYKCKKLSEYKVYLIDFNKEKIWDKDNHVGDDEKICKIKISEKAMAEIENRFEILDIR